MNETVVTSKLQVGALKECSDFLVNGYTQVFSYRSDSLWMMKLKHAKNGRTLIVTWKPDGYRITENGLILKAVGSWL